MRLMAYENMIVSQIPALDLRARIVLYQSREYRDSLV